MKLAEPRYIFMYKESSATLVSCLESLYYKHARALICRRYVRNAFRTIPMCCTTCTI